MNCHCKKFLSVVLVIAIPNIVTTFLKTRIVSVLNGPVSPDPESSKEAEKATRFTERETQLTHLNIRK